MSIRLFEIENGIVKASEHCYTIDAFKQIMKEYPKDHNKIFAFYHYMCCLNDEENPFANTPEADKEELILKEVSGDFSTDEEMIYNGLQLCKKLYSTPTAEAYLDIKIALEKLGKYMRLSPITDGRDGNVMAILRVAEKYDEVCKSFESRYRAFKEENSRQARGGQNMRIRSIMNYLYKIQNIINGKIYIGVSKNPNRRFNYHLNMLKKNKHHSIKLQNDFNIFGIENFKFKILENNIENKDLDSKEIQYIYNYNSYNNGYNCTIGGNINLIGNKAWKGKFGGDHNVAIKVYQYNLNGEFIKEWSSVIDAARSLNKNRSHLISYCCKGKSYSAYRYYWSYNFLGNKIPQIKKNLT